MGVAVTILPFVVVGTLLALVVAHEMNVVQLGDGLAKSRRAGRDGAGYLFVRFLRVGVPVLGSTPVTQTVHMTDEATRVLLDRFVSVVRPVVPLSAVWAHGSLAGGDYQSGRSDLDLIAVLDRPCTTMEEQRLGEVHKGLGSALPLASKLHCSYLPAGELDDPARSHLTWAHEELLRRPVTPVTRRELHDFGLTLYGQAPATLLPPVTDGQLADFIVDDLKSFWRPSLDHPERWTRDIWVDLGLLTLARATVTLRDGRLITKAAALDVLTGMGAPPEVVDDIRQRRYGDPATATEQWTARRAELTLTFLKPAIEHLIADGSLSGG